jgi:hypothetical protein
VAKLYKYVEDSEKPFVCRKCGKGFTSEGGFNLHGPCGPGYRKGRNQQLNDKGGGCSCGGSVRLLNAENQQESRAIAAGYVAVCKKCDNLIK